jgi:hypothetical protein
MSPPTVTNQSRCDLTHDLVLPTLLFAALGGMTWAVRGCSGFGAVPGCLFAGVTWGAAWWYIARDPSREQTRRYASGWIILAVTLGVGLSGGRGWMQWPSFFAGQIQTNSDKGEYLPISRDYGFLWLFIAGVPWAGLGACALAWCGSQRETRIWHWILRIACGVGVAALMRWLIQTYPQHFLPLYDSLKSRYHDAEANPNLRRLTNDCTAAFVHLGYYLGFLLYEFVRRDWKNAVLILTVGLVNGTGWALCQNWNWAHEIWPAAHFNFWRCWESSGGISIGIAYGIAYFLVNRRMSERERAIVASQRAVAGPNFEWLLVFLGLTVFVGYLFSFRLGTWNNVEFTFTVAGHLFNFRLGDWGCVEFAVVLATGTLYYFANRRRPLGMAVFVSSLTILCYLAAPIARLLSAHPARLIRRPDVLARDCSLVAAIPFAVGLGWYLLNYRSFEEEKQLTTPADGDPNVERLGLYLGLLTGLGLSIRNGLKGWFNIYCANKDQYWTQFFWQHFHARGDEHYWDRLLWRGASPIYVACLVAIAWAILSRPRPRDSRSNPFPHAYGAIWLVLIVQNAIAQLITGPLDHWTEVAFSIYYAILFALTAVIVIHYQSLKTPRSLQTSVAGDSREGRPSGAE